MSLAASQRIRKLFKQTTSFSLLLSVSVYGWARILFFEVPFTLAEDLPIFAKIILLCWIMVLSSLVAFSIIVKIGTWIQRPRLLSSFNKKWKITFVAIATLSVFLLSSNV